MKRIPILFFFLFSAVANAATLPGFRIEPVAPIQGFLTSLVTDSRGTIYYTRQSGEIMRAGSASVVARVATEATGDAGLLGMALIDDDTAVVHYTTAAQAYHVISRIDLRDGSETVVHEFPSDVTNPGARVETEHHGGNLIVVGGTIYFGIGDFGTPQLAADPAWNAGKIFQIAADGTVTQLARGFRNPFDMAWEPAGGRLVVVDNGDVADDEINVVAQAGGFFGWPCTAGNIFPPCEGAIPPLYSFPTVVAPTGIVRMSGANPLIRRGYLLSAFVTRAIYYVPDIDAQPFPDPIAITTKDVAQIIDVTESPAGEIYFGTGTAIYRLVPPTPGDCNADGVVDLNDLTALERELGRSAGETAYRASSWGCDADGDGFVTWNDYAALRKSMGARTRAVRH